MGQTRYIILIYIQSWPIAMTNEVMKKKGGKNEKKNKNKNELSSNYIFTHSKFLSSSFVS